MTDGHDQESIKEALERSRECAFEADLGALKNTVGENAVLTSKADLLVYETDALTCFRQPPLAVVLPRSTEEVAEVVRWCNRLDVPFVPRGAGTGLSGGALPVKGCIVIETARMNRILEVNAVDRYARVEPGVVNLELSKAVNGLGLHYAPDPSSQSACTIGGNIAENSGGPHCMKYGMTTQHILGLTVVTGEGKIVRLGGPQPELPGLDLVGLFVGSEGTFGIVTEAIVRLTPLPQSICTLLFAFSSMEDACRAVSSIVAAGIQPAALEMLDQKTIEVVEDSVLAAGYPRSAAAVLLVELDGLEAQVKSDTGRTIEQCARCGSFETREAISPEDRAKLWKGRKGAFGALGRLKPDLYVQDAVVPRSSLSRVLPQILEIARRNRVLLTNVFHAGDGNLHPNISYDGRDAEETARVIQTGEEILRLCVESGGSLSGEHGIGIEKKDYMSFLFSDADLEEFRKVKEVFNPRSLCNPGKALPSPKVCAEFKEGSSAAGLDEEPPRSFAAGAGR